MPEKERIIGKFMTIDPGVNMGFAVFSPDQVTPIDTHLIKVPKDSKWLATKAIVFSGTKKFLEQWKAKELQHCFIEQPQFFSSALGLVAAKSDALLKLIHIAAITEYQANELNIETKMLRIVDWKGQLSKEQVSWRIGKILGASFPNHIADAVGMGLYLKGELLEK